MGVLYINSFDHRTGHGMGAIVLVHSEDDPDCAIPDAWMNNPNESFWLVPGTIDPMA